MRCNLLSNWFDSLLFFFPLWTWLLASGFCLPFFFGGIRDGGQEDRWLAGSNDFALSFPGIFFHFFSLNSSTHICIFSIIAHACAAAAAACASQAVCPAPKTIEIRRRCSSCGEKAFLFQFFDPPTFVTGGKKNEAKTILVPSAVMRKRNGILFSGRGERGEGRTSFCLFLCCL